MSSNQYHKLAHALYQIEGATDEIIEKQRSGGHDEKSKEEWQKIRNSIKDECMSVYREIENPDKDEDINIEKENAQEEYKQKQMKDGLMMFEKGSRNKKKARAAAEESSDEEDSCQVACNMTGMEWESFPFTIIVDSGACASVMPQDWCEHVPIRDTKQSIAGEYFRAPNGQKIHNQGEKECP